MPDLPVREQIMHSVNDAGKNLLRAYNLATAANAMASDLVVFKELLEMQKRLGVIMQEISRVRGL